MVINDVKNFFALSTLQNFAEMYLWSWRL